MNKQHTSLQSLKSEIKRNKIKNRIDALILISICIATMAVY